LETPDGLFEAVALDQAHGVEGPAIGVDPQAVDGHDPGVLQATGHFRLQEEARPAVGVIVAGLDLLECHLAVQFLVAGHEHLAQAAVAERENPKQQWQCQRRFD
jgi:hypothetical protein